MQCLTTHACAHVGMGHVIKFQHISRSFLLTSLMVRNGCYVLDGKFVNGPTNVSKAMCSAVKKIDDILLTNVEECRLVYCLLGHCFQRSFVVIFLYLNELNFRIHT